MSTIYRRRPRRRATASHTLPLLAILTIIAALLCGLYLLYGSKVKAMFVTPPPTIVYSNKQANDNLEKLLGDLAGNKSTLLQLTDNSRSRLGWIKDPVTRRRMRWILMERLIDLHEWQAAMQILPSVEELATEEQLDRLAVAALMHNDLELQLRLDRRLQELAMHSPSKVRLQLRSIRRTVETSLKLKRADEAIKAIARLELPSTQARLTDPLDASEAASLLMICADLSEVKEPVLQKVRNVLEAANWPSCPATAKLIIEEVSGTVRDNPRLSEVAMREIEGKLIKSRDSMFDATEDSYLLPQCYSLLGDLRYRMKDYDGCVSALAMATALAEGYATLTPELKIRLTRLRSRANEQRGAMDEALMDCRILAESDPDPKERLRSLMLLAAHAQGDDKVARLQQCWELIAKNEKLSLEHLEYRKATSIELAAYYKAKEDYTRAVKWMKTALEIIKEQAQPLSNGDSLERQLELALVYRKARNDREAIRRLLTVIRIIEAMDEEQRTTFDKAAPQLYKMANRELARTYLLTGDSYTARQVSRKIKEGLPSNTR